MFLKGRKPAAIFLALAVMISFMPFYGIQTAYAENGNSDSEESFGGYADSLDPLTVEEGEQILPVTIDLESGTAIVEGSEEVERFEDVYDFPVPKKRSIENSTEGLDKEEVLDFLLEKPCAVYEKDDGTLRAEYPLSLKILFVLIDEGKLDETYGAVNALYDSEGERYVLQFTSQEDTAYAYSQLAEKYGRENVLIDLAAAPSAGAVSYDETYEQDLFKRTTAKSISWGTDAMYLDYLRDWIQENPPELPSNASYCMVAVVDTGLRVDETNEEIIDGYGIDASRVAKSWCTAISSRLTDYTAFNDYSETNWQPSKCRYADLKGHGTHVMSTILDGTPFVPGTSCQVKTFAIRDANTAQIEATNAEQYSTGDIDGMTNAVRYAGELGAKVVNMSQSIRCYDSETEQYSGYYGKGYPEFDNITLDTFFYYNNEIASYCAKYDMNVVVSSGNDGEDMEDLAQFPSLNNGVTVVSNITSKPNVGFIINPSSSYGDNVAFCAPGTQIVGAGYDWEEHKPCFVKKTGTSMATPHIAAALATLRVYYRDLDADGAVNLLAQTCKDLGEEGRDRQYGYGVPQFNPVTVTFDYNDDSLAAESHDIPKTMLIAEPAKPAKASYIFDGWYSDEALTEKYDFSKPVLGDLTLYAKWTKKAALQKAANPLSVKGKTAKVKYSKLRKKAQKLKVGKVMTFKNKGKGTLSYSLSSAKKGKKSFKKYFRINSKTGKVTVKKKLKKGTYTVKAKVKAAGNSGYKAATKTVTFKIKVK